MMEAVHAPVQPRQEAAPAPAKAAWRFPWYGYAAGILLGSALITAMLFTPVASGDWGLALLILPQALATAVVAGTWIAFVVSDPPVDKA